LQVQTNKQREMNVEKKMKVKNAKGKNPSKQPKQSRAQGGQRRERRRNTLESAPDRLLKIQGNHGTDIRTPDGQTRGAAHDAMVVSGSSNVLSVSCNYIDRSVSYLAMGIVLKAMQKGYRYTDGSFLTCPYYAFRYIIDCVKSAMAGNIPQLQQAPMWFWDLLYALKQKTVRFKTAEIKYSWVELTSGQADDVAFTLGTAVDAYTLFWGVGGSLLTINVFQFLEHLRHTRPDQFKVPVHLMLCFHSTQEKELVG